MWDKKSAERAPRPQRILGHGVHYLLSPARGWEACTRAPSPAVLGTSTPLGCCSNQESCKTETSPIVEFSFMKSQGGINENYWARKGAGYQKKPRRPRSEPARQWEPGNQTRSTSDWVAQAATFSLNPQKPAAFNDVLAGEVKSVQGSSQTGQVPKLLSDCDSLGTPEMRCKACFKSPLCAALLTCCLPHPQTPNITKKITQMSPKSEKKQQKSPH